MSPAPRVILLDSNAYSRLAHSIHPLLAEPFGPPPPYSLKVIEEVGKEYARSPRLQTKFHWPCERKYVDDRDAHTYNCRGKVATQVEASFSYLAEYAKSQSMSLSRIDIRALAVGVARDVTVVSDDANMETLAKVFQIEFWSVLKLLKVMVDEKRIGMDKVKEILEYWQHENDLPAPLAKLRQQYHELFRTACPV